MSFTVVRTWKRDRSQNFMTLEAATANLRRYGNRTARLLAPGRLSARLLRGEEFETAHATFRVAGTKGD